MKYLIPASVLLSAALFVRQTSLVPILVTGLWLLYNKSYKPFLFFILLIIIIVTPITFVLTNTSDGGYLWQQYIMPTGVQKNLHVLVAHITEMLKAPTTILSIVIIVCMLFYSRIGLKSFFSFQPTGKNLLIQYCGVAFLLAAVTSTRIGSNINYWQEFWASASLAVPCLMERELLDKLCTKYSNRTIFTIIVFTCATLFSGIRVVRGEYFRWNAVKYQEAIVSTLANCTPKNEPVFSAYPNLAVDANRKYYINDFCQYDGRSSSHELLFNDLINSGICAALINADSVSPTGYYRATINVPLPEKVYPLYLHFRNDINLCR